MFPGFAILEMISGQSNLDNDLGLIACAKRERNQNPFCVKMKSQPNLSWMRF